MGSKLLSPFCEFCHPGSNFHGKKIKNLAIVDDVFFSLEIELRLNRQLNGLLGIFFSFTLNKNF